MKVQFHNVTFLRLRVLIELEMGIYRSCVWICKELTIWRLLEWIWKKSENIYYTFIKTIFKSIVLHGESFSFFSFSVLPPLPWSAFLSLLGLSGAGNRVELGCAPGTGEGNKGRPKAPTTPRKCQSAAPGERMTKGRRCPSISYPDCVPFWCCTRGRSLCLLGLPTPQNTWLFQHVLRQARSWSHTNSLLCCCLIV